MSPDAPESSLEPDRSPPGDAEAVLAVLAEWLPAQRWFAGTAGQASGTSLVERTAMVTTEGGLAVELVLVAADTSTGRATYQVLLGWRADPPERMGHAIIGTVGDSICYDALHDHEFTALLLAALAEGGSLGSVTAVAEPGAEIDSSAPGLVITAEQSNTSIVYGDTVILKMFRRLTAGTNPDAEIHRALHAVGCEHVAEPLGELVGVVDTVPTTLGLATRYFANSADGWAMATASVRDLMAEGDLHADEVGGDFAAESHRLGEAVAAVHRDLVRAFGSSTLPPDSMGSALADMAERAERLAGRVPQLAEYVPAIHRAYQRARIAAAARPEPIQRIHGDLHLGQALRTLGGWALIDFEGEPSRPVATRRRMQSPLRDVAGMLRSFDYAAHQPFITVASDAQHNYRAAEWAQRNRSAFCDGYAAVAGFDPRENAPLLGAFELAKAVYEVGYEHGHRPHWEQIPLAAVAELTATG